MIFVYIRSRNYHPDYHTIVWIIYKNLFIHRSRIYHPEYHTIARIMYKNLFIHTSRNCHPDDDNIARIIYSNLFIHKSRNYRPDYHTINNCWRGVILPCRQYMAIIYTQVEKLSSELSHYCMQYI